MAQSAEEFLSDLSGRERVFGSPPMTAGGNVDRGLEDQLFKLRQQQNELKMLQRRSEVAAENERRQAHINSLRTNPYNAAYPPLRDGISNRRAYQPPRSVGPPVRSAGGY
jgi:hypothetical protein